MLKNRTNILSAKIKKVVKKSPVNQSGLKQAYELVAKDLLTNLKKAKDGTQIKLGDCGTFHKKLSIITNPYGDACRYYRVSFKVSEKLRGKNL